MPRESLEELVNLTYFLLNAERVSMFGCLNTESDSLECFFSEDIQGYSVPINKSILGRSFMNNEVLNVADVKACSHYSGVDEKVGYQTRSVLSAPIVSSNGEVIGVLQAINKRSGDFTSADEYQISSICTESAILLQKRIDRKKYHESICLNGSEEYEYSSAQSKPLRKETSNSHVSNKISEADLLLVSMDIPDSDLFSWDFDVSIIENKACIRSIIYRLVERTCHLQSVQITPEAFIKFLGEVESFYHDNAFHNYWHAACVTHFTCMLCSAVNAQKLFGSYFQFAVVVSALVHDLDHPGHTNSFEIKIKSKLASMYDNQSVLENHHCATACRILQKPGSESMLPSSHIEYICNVVSACVLATDMSVHSNLLFQFDAKTRGN